MVYDFFKLFFLVLLLAMPKLTVLVFLGLIYSFIN